MGTKGHDKMINSPVIGLAIIFLISILVTAIIYGIVHIFTIISDKKLQKEVDSIPYEPPTYYYTAEFTCRTQEGMLYDGKWMTAHTSFPTVSEYIEKVSHDDYFAGCSDFQVKRFI